MKKIKAMYYDKEVGGSYSTGLVLVLEDGTTLRHCSTDVVLTFEPFISDKEYK